MSRTIAILGAGGLLGRHLVAVCGPDLIPLDRAACDVTDLGQVTECTRRADVIINCAAFTDVDGAETHEKEAFLVNATGAENAAKAAKARGATLVHISTDYVFDGAQSVPYDEGAVPNPQSVYAKSKYEGEKRVTEVGGQVIIVRTQALYGVGGLSFASRLREFILAKKPLVLDCERRVQPTWARSTAAQIAHIVHSAVYGTCHVSTTGETTWTGFARRMADRLGVVPNWRDVSTCELGGAAARPPNCLFDHKALRECGLFRMPSWEDALDGYLLEVEDK